MAAAALAPAIGLSLPMASTLVGLAAGEGFL